MRTERDAALRYRASLREPVRDAAAARNGSALLDNLGALRALIALPRSLVSAASHDILLSYRRMQFLSERAGVAALVLAVTTVGWIPVDAFLLGLGNEILPYLIAGRLIAASVFLLIASARFRGDSPARAMTAIGLTIATGVAFFVYVHLAFEISGQHDLLAAGHAQYIVMPIALAAGIAVFPLTVIEALALCALPLLAFLAEALHADAGAFWLQIGTAAGLMGGIVLIAVLCSVSQLKLLIDLHENASSDPLTGVLVRRVGVELIAILFAHACRSGRPLALALLDLDRFKLVNDGFGHEAGDAVLQAVAQKLKSRLRQDDALIRWGGEEFVIVLPGTSASQAAALLAGVGGADFAARPDGSPQTLSVGLADSAAERVGDWRSLLNIADRRMYAAKAAGRNRMVTCDGASALSAGAMPFA